jgi:hypothetical protein
VYHTLAALALSPRIQLSQPYRFLRIGYRNPVSKRPAQVLKCFRRKNVRLVSELLLTDPVTRVQLVTGLLNNCSPTCVRWHQMNVAVEDEDADP